MILVLDAMNEGRLSLAGTFNTLRELHQWRMINPNRVVIAFPAVFMDGGTVDVIGEFQKQLGTVDVPSSLTDLEFAEMVKGQAT